MVIIIYRISDALMDGIIYLGSPSEFPTIIGRLYLILFPIAICLQIIGMLTLVVLNMLLWGGWVYATAFFDIIQGINAWIKSIWKDK